MIMTPTPYSPYGLVAPWSHEPLPLQSHCCGFFTTLVVGTSTLQAMADETYRVVLGSLRHQYQV